MISYIQIKHLSIHFVRKEKEKLFFFFWYKQQQLWKTEICSLIIHLQKDEKKNIYNLKC